MEIKYLLIVVEPAGWIILDSPQSRTSGAIQRRAERVGQPLHAFNIFAIEGVPYAWLVPKDSNKPEWGRVSEKGGVIFDEDGNVKEQVAGVKAYVRIINLYPQSHLAELVNRGSDELIEVLKELANASTLLATALRELARRS